MDNFIPAELPFQLMYNIDMHLSVFTHNLLYHRAFSDVKRMLLSYKPDIICLQEVEMDTKSFASLKSHGYLLAGTSNTFVSRNKAYYVATFYNSQSLRLLESEIISLPRTYYETILYHLRGAHNPRTVLKTHFQHSSGRDVAIYNIHLTPFASNGGRVRQLIAAFDDMKQSRYERVIFAGDFNYPYRRRKLEELIHAYRLKEATSNLSYTFKSSFLRILPVKLKDDYIFYRGMKALRTERIKKRFSDHYPVNAEFSLS